MINRVVRNLRALLAQRDGATAIEYALIAALLALALIPGLAALGDWQNSAMLRVVTQLL
jgi:Flp pilus assembly pilin Flp